MPIALAEGVGVFVCDAHRATVSVFT